MSASSKTLVGLFAISFVFVCGFMYWAVNASVLSVPIALGVLVVVLISDVIVVSKIMKAKADKANS